MHALWERKLGNNPRGLCLAREKGWLLAWDDKNWLYLLNQAGEVQAQRQFPGALASACCAEDGSAYAAVGSRGEVLWLAPDLMPRWEVTVPQRALAAALDPFGQYLAVSDMRGSVHIFDRFGRPACQVESPRPLHHLAFVPTAPFLIGASDYGLVACLDLAGHWVWRDGLVAHIGSLTVSGDGNRILLACFTEGFLSYSLTGAKMGRLCVSWPCRLASLSFDGQLVLVAWLTKQLILLDGDGKNLCTHPLAQPLVALALGALGDTAYVALADGPVVGYGLSKL